MYRVQVQTPWLTEFEDRPERFNSYEDAVEFCGKLFDEAEVGDFIVRDVEWNRPLKIEGYKLTMHECPICGKAVRSVNMLMTRDCHGIPFRAVCPECYNRQMRGVGYDGMYYDELDEVIEPDDYY